MKWDKSDVGNFLFCKEASLEDISAIAQKSGTFLSGCKSKYPGVRRQLEDGLNDFVRDLKAGPAAAPTLSLEAIKFLLRWCVTDGRHLQDFRRDNARALWRVLFRGTIPEYYQYDSQHEEYREDAMEQERWIQTQVTDDLAGQTGAWTQS